MRAAPLIALLLFLAGCSGSPDDAGTAPLPAWLDLNLKQVLGEDQPLALVGAFDVNGTLLWVTSASLNGTVHAKLTGRENYFIDWHDGHTHLLSVTGADGERHAEVPSPIRLNTRYSFPNPTNPAQIGTTCTEKNDGDTGCGLDEPSIVVDGLGRIFYTAACCFFTSSPVWVSSNQGAAFTAVPSPVKDAYGNEGDVWLDSAGNLYYMDIDLATFGIAQWDKDLKAGHSYRRPGQPLVDRPWIRATTDGNVFAIYNTGYDTVVYASSDKGLTFSAAPVTAFGAGLATGYSDSRHNIVGMYGSGAYSESKDNGKTWTGQKSVKCTTGAGGTETANVDEAGTVWFLRGSCVTGRQANGTFTKPVSVTPEGMEVFMSWLSAGGKGAVAVAYYGQVADEASATSLGVKADSWYTFVAFSMDADAANPHWANFLLDPDPVAVGTTGDVGRRLGDFMEVAIAPNGGIHVAYARNAEMDDSATATYRGTAEIPEMAPEKPLVGPYAS